MFMKALFYYNYFVKDTKIFGYILQTVGLRVLTELTRQFYTCNKSEAILQHVSSTETLTSSFTEALTVTADKRRQHGRHLHLVSRCQTSKSCETGSVRRSCDGLIRWSDATADGDARRPVTPRGTADAAAVAPSNWPQDSRAQRDGAAVCQSPARGTGHLHLQENGSCVFKKKKSEGKVWRHFYPLKNTHLISISWYVLQQVALQGRSVAAHSVRCHPVPHNATPPITVAWTGARWDPSRGPRCAAWKESRHNGSTPRAPSISDAPPSHRQVGENTL